MREVKHLLQLVKFIKDRYREKPSHDFNIFKVLRNERDEVNLHSRFIYELLSSIDGYSHRFLELFLTNIGLDKTYLDGKVIVRREYKNIDLLIQTEDKVIIVENKIYGIDQDRQLERYYEEFENSRKEIKMYYLTLDGSNPSNQSLGDKLCLEDDTEEGKHQVVNISYKNNISNWLEECIKEVALEPSIRETLVQYLEVVNRLSGNTQNKNVQNEIASLLLKSSESLNLGLDIVKGYEKAIVDLKLKFWEELEEEIKECQELVPWEKYKYSTSEIKGNKKFYGLMYPIFKINAQDTLMLYFEINDKFYYGYVISRNGEYQKLAGKETFSEVKEIIHTTSSEQGIERLESLWWLFYTYPNKELNYRDPNEELLKLADKEFRAIFINKIVEDSSKLTEAILKELKKLGENV